MRDTSQELGQALIFTGFWAPDSGTNQKAAPSPEDVHLVFGPQGTIMSNATLLDGAYRLVVANGLVYGGGSVTGQNSFALTGVTQARTISVSPSGNVRVSPGLHLGSTIATVQAEELDGDPLYVQWECDKGGGILGAHK